MGIEQANNTLVLASPLARPAGFYERFGKRILDVVLCLIILPVAGPFIAVFWLLGRSDGGPGFYLQDRVGRNGVVFRCWKIRTMIPRAETALQQLLTTDHGAAAEWQAAQKLANDPRVTRWGRLMRATGIDELPQIWNVLKGEMSLIGPRPFTPIQQARYQMRNPDPAYYRLRPGISGLWQVTCRNTGAFSDRIRWDEIYGREMSFYGDLTILLRTVLVVCRAQGR